MSGTAASEGFVDVRKMYVDVSPTPRIFRWFGAKEQSQSILRDISFQLPLGTHATLFGQSASGKTTLLLTLAGFHNPSRGSVHINSRLPAAVKDIAAGYVSSKESEASPDTCHQMLSAFARTHRIEDPAARIQNIGDILSLNNILHRPAHKLSVTEQLRMNIARAALSDSPLVLFDDVTDHLGSRYVSEILPLLFDGRTVITATRFSRAADRLGLPVLLIHKGTLAHQGTIDEIALDLACPRIVDVWVEGLRYDMLRQVRKHAGVEDVQLVPSSQFSGQRLRVTLHSARYLPAFYDLISQAPLIQIHEIPPSLNDIINRL